MKDVAKALILVIAIASIGSAAAAILLEGAGRIVFGAAAVVFLFTAVYSAAEMWFETRKGKPLDIEAPPPITPLPESPVTEIYDPRSPPTT